MNVDETDKSARADVTDTESRTVHDAIMEATYRALCDHGAADLTVQTIADEFDKSKSLIFYHYGSKESLLSSFLAYLLTRFEDRVAAADFDDPVKQLDGLIDGLLFGPDDNESFQTAMLELRSQAPFNEAYREQFRTNDEYVRKVFEAVIEHGIEEDVFAPVDPEHTASMVLTTIDGARTRWVVLGDDEILDTTRAVIDDQLDATVFADAVGAK